MAFSINCDGAVGHPWGENILTETHTYMNDISGGSFCKKIGNRLSLSGAELAGVESFSLCPEPPDRPPSQANVTPELLPWFVKVHTHQYYLGGLLEDGLLDLTPRVSDSQLVSGENQECTL